MASRRRIWGGGDPEFIPSSLPTRVLSRGIPAPDNSHLRLLKNECGDPPIVAFATWNDVSRWLVVAGVRAEAADVVLRPVLTAFRRGAGDAWYHALLFLFCPHLDQIARHLHRLDEDAAVLDSQVHWAFLQAVHRIDPERRRTGLGRKILNDVQHDVRQFYARENALRKQFARPANDGEDDDPEALIDNLGGEDPGFERADARHDANWARALLESLVDRGRLSEPDYLIFIGRYLYGHSLWDLAAQQGVSYAAARKREQRVRKLLQENARKLSHRRGSAPLGPVRKHLPQKEES